jgi:uncharacterized membrane protein (UPF0182 family)
MTMHWQRSTRIVILLLGLGFGWDLACRLGAEIFWFQEVDYLFVYLTRLFAKGTVWIATFGVTLGYLLFNLFLAGRLQYAHPTDAERSHLEKRILDRQNRQKKRLFFQKSEKSEPYPLQLPWLLSLSLGLAVLMGFLLVSYARVAFHYWYPDPHQVITLVPGRAQLDAITEIVNQFRDQPWYLAIVAVVAVLLLFYTRFWLTILTVVMSLVLASSLSEHWDKVLLFFQPTSFHASESVFHQDMSFYIFILPVLELLEFWSIGLSLFSFLAVLLCYLLSGDSINLGWFRGFSRAQERHLSAVGGCLMLVIAFGYWLDRYELLYSPRGVIYGAGYTDVMVQLPVNTTFSLLAGFIALLLLKRVIFPPRSPLRPSYRLLSLLLLIVVIGAISPSIVQYSIVQPNELSLEQPYIKRTIALTRQAFDLENIDEQSFDPQATLTETDLRNNSLTLSNIRLWDERPLLQTNRELQQIRPYYRFPDANIDRYSLARGNDPEQRQVLIAARELDYSAVPQKAQTWVNQHLIYTHGYGFTVSPVNTVAPGGLPEYFVKDIGAGEAGALTVSGKSVANSIPIGNPRIYYGELTTNYVMTGTRIKELDYPSGSDNVYNRYDGRGGIKIQSLWRRLLFAKYLKDWRMVLTPEFTDETKVLFRRNVNQRIRAIAPFLHYDSDPYLVSVDVSPVGTEKPSYLYWMIDAYTTSEHYPYSDPTREGLNYIRNSVKVVVDAYHGSVTFYIADPSDPIITTWSRIFPDLFQPLSAMPANLRHHIRYPIDFFNIQSERLMTYHMLDPQVFYNREDQWEIANEVYGSKAKLVEPYYLITRLPTVPFEEFILLLPYTPRQRSNLIAWLAARSDGENYGKLLLYTFPKQRLIYGPEQIEARINQDPVISQQITLWNRQGSQVIQGNLLIIPIEHSLLYVEPLYLEAAQNSLPTLVRVIVAYENRIVMAQTLEQSLQAIFQDQKTPQPIVRTVVESADSP